MKKSCTAVLLLAVTSAVARASSTLDTSKVTGARNVSVALFTARDVRALSVAPAAEGAWQASCATCLHKPLPVRIIVSSGEMFLGGTLRIEDASGASAAVVSTGLWHLRSNAHGMDVVLTMPSERYTAAAVSGEAAADEPAESLRALAIVARTYALNGRHYSAGAGHLSADLCDSTACQALRMGAVPRSVAEAVNATAGETLWFGSHRAEVFFSGACGGQTADVREVWATDADAKIARPAPYLTSHADPFCLRQGTAAWHTSIALDQLGVIARQQGWRLPARITRVGVAERSASGRARRLSFQGSGSEAAPVSASSLRFAIGRALGWNRIRSDLYDVALRGGDLVFDGRGHGHGVGLCQAGATVMAQQHNDARAILGFYFPGTHVRVTSGDDGWRNTQAGPVLLRSVETPSVQLQAAIASAWNVARMKFPVTGAVTPTVVLSPSTELFRQMTAQPGWDLASTRGSVTTLQPERVLLRASGGLEGTLRHEFLHALIEHEATDRAPLWLREGLAEALGSDLVAMAGTGRTGSEMDSMLLHDASAAEARAGHAAAGLRVHQLLVRYGFLNVRGWLRSGAPSSVDAER